MNILLVDDDFTISYIIKKELVKHSYSVDSANDGVNGLKMAMDPFKSYDVILLDWMLPGLTGIELCKRIRTHNQDIPIIFITGNDTSEDAINAFDAGATDFLRKPFALGELIARIKVILRSNNMLYSTEMD